MGMFGDPIENMAYDIAALEAENKKLRKLVNDACAIAYQLRTGGMWRDKTLIDVELKRILTEAHLLNKDGTPSCQ